jgi:hypothetical protein
MSTIKEGCFHLDNPFEENDEAKSLGAKWGGKYIRKWYVPQELSNQIHKFPSRWNPKLYLKCPYKEKDQAKQAGAKWDKDVRRWYITPNENTIKFTKWLIGGAQHLARMPTTVASTPALTPTYASSPPSIQYETVPTSLSTLPSPQSDRGPTRRGNAEMAKLLRINPNMTVSQLKVECRHRGVGGVSNKNKDWLLDKLGLGTTWESERASTNSSAGQSSSSNNQRKRQAESDGHHRSKRLRREGVYPFDDHCSYETCKDGYQRERPKDTIELRVRTTSTNRGSRRSISIEQW